MNFDLGKPAARVTAISAFLLSDCRSVERDATEFESKMKPAKSWVLYLALAGSEASTTLKVSASRSVVDGLKQFRVTRLFQTGLS